MFEPRGPAQGQSSRELGGSDVSMTPVPALLMFPPPSLKTGSFLEQGQVGHLCASHSVCPERKLFVTHSKGEEYMPWESKAGTCVRQGLGHPLRSRNSRSWYNHY